MAVFSSVEDYAQISPLKVTLLLVSKTKPEKALISFFLECACNQKRAVKMEMT